MKRVTLFILTLLLLSAYSSGQSAGDYRSYITGTWASPSSWQIYDGSSWLAATYYPGELGDINYTITIRTNTAISGGANVNFTSGGAISVSNGGRLDMGTYNINGPLPSLLVTGGGTFTSNGSVTADDITVFGDATTGGTVTVTSLLVKPTGSYTNNGTLLPSILTNWDIFNSTGPISAGSVYCFGGAITTTSYVDADIFAIYGAGSFITSYPGSSGWWSVREPVSIILYGSIEFNGTADQKIPGYGYYYTCIVTNSSTKQLTGDVTIYSTFTISGNSTLDVNGHTLEVNGPGIAFNGGTIMGGTGSVLNFNRGSAVPQDISGTGGFSGTFDAVNVGTASQSCVNFSIANGGGTGLLSTSALVIDGSPLHGSYFNIGATSWVTAGSVTINVSNGLILQTGTGSAPTSASLLVTGSISGVAEVDYYLPAGGLSAPWLWHYIASPISDCSTANFLTDPSNLAQYVESLITTDQSKGWVATDGYKYSDGSMTGPTFNSLTLGKGYNYFNKTEKSVQTNGTINTATVSGISLSYNGAGNSNPSKGVVGWNLLGNPFSCSMDWTAIEPSLDAAIDKAIYFTNGSGTFSTWINGVGANGGSPLIPPMQGFFVHTTAGGKSITLPSSAKTHSGVARYKSANIIPLIRLALKGQPGVCDAVVRFDENATADTDRDFDALLMGKTSGRFNVWTKSNGSDYAVNGLPFPGILLDSLVIPVGIYITAEGTYTLSATQITGLDSYNYTITLKDKLNNVETDLRKNPSLSFSSSAGVTDGRFILKITNSVTGINETKSVRRSFNIFESFGILNIQALDDTFAGKSSEIRIMDITGRLLFDEKNVIFMNGDIKQISLNTEPGVYLVEIGSGTVKYTGRIVIN
jgi:hypothetical protein